MTTGTIHCKADSNGRVVVESLPLLAGQDVELTWKVVDEGNDPPPPSWEEIQAQRRRMRGSLVRDDTDPEEPACNPSKRCECT